MISWEFRSVHIEEQCILRICCTRAFLKTFIKLECRAIHWDFLCFFLFVSSSKPLFQGVFLTFTQTDITFCPYWKTKRFTTQADCCDESVQNKSKRDFPIFWRYSSWEQILTGKYSKCEVFQPHVHKFCRRFSVYSHHVDADRKLSRRDSH